MVPRRLLVLLATLPEVACDCGRVPQPEPSESSSTSDPMATSSAADTTTSPECAGDGLCIQIPMGWGGPVWLRDEESCDGRLSHSDLMVLPVECSCACDPTSPCSLTARVFGDSQCTDLVAEFAVEPHVCVPVPTVPDGGRISFVSTSDPGAACEARDQAFPFFEPEWGSTRRACEEEYEQCGPRGICRDEQDPVCIWTHGDVECPVPFTEREVRFSSFIDTRACEGCACGPLDVPDCAPGGAIGYGEDRSDCNGGAGLFDCGAVPFGPPPFMFVDVTLAQCEPTASSELVGEAVAIDPLTYCCFPSGAG